MEISSVTGFGLLLTTEEAKELAKKMKKEDFFELTEAVGNLWTEDDYNHSFYFDGESTVIDEINMGEPNFSEGFLIFADHQPTPFAAAYRSVLDCTKEFKDRIGVFLPSEFDYESHLAMVCGTFAV